MLFNLKSLLSIAVILQAINAAPTEAGYHLPGSDSPSDASCVYVYADEIASDDFQPTKSTLTTVSTFSAAQETYNTGTVEITTGTYNPITTSEEQNTVSTSSTETSSSTSPVSTSVFGSEVHKGIATYYGVGVGNCGKRSTDSEFVCAISQKMYNTLADSYSISQYCGHMINVTHDGKTIQVKVVDSCPECDENHLDLSPAAFNSLADPVLGIIDIEWTWA